MNKFKCITLEIVETDAMTHSVFVSGDQTWEKEFEKDDDEGLVRYEHMSCVDKNVEPISTQTYITFKLNEFEKLAADKGYDIKITERNRLVPLVANGEDITKIVEDIVGAPVERYNAYRDVIEVWVADEDLLTLVPEFKNYSEFSLWCDAHDDRIETVLDYTDSEGYGWRVIKLPNNKYYYENCDENDADFCEVELAAELKYNPHHEVGLYIGDDENLQSMFSSLCCGETDDLSSYLWFTEVKK